MRSIMLRLSGIGCLVLIVLLLGESPVVQAQNPVSQRLQGDFRAAFTATCTQDPVGFDDNLKSLSGATSLTPFQINFKGSLHYNGDGTGTFQHHRLAFIGTGTQQPLFEADGTCTFTYTVNPDGTFSQLMDCTSTILKGAVPSGQIITETAMLVEGSIGEGLGHKILILTNTSPSQFVITRSGPPLVTAKRICGLNGLAHEIRPGVE
jgi:hypothetical protein